MNSNLNLPLTNELLRKSIMKKKQVGQTEGEAVQVKNFRGYQDNQHQWQEHAMGHSESLGPTVNTSLNYSTDGYLMDDSDSTAFKLVSEESLRIYTSPSSTQLLNQLLYCDQQTPVNAQYLHEGVIFNKQEHNVTEATLSENNPFENHQISENIEDYSKELITLKSKIIEIECLAQQEIVRLKQELAQQKGFQTCPQKIEVGVNTEPDLRDLQLQMLKEALLRHMALNKQLLGKHLQAQSFPLPCKQNLQGYINKIVI